MDESGTRLLAKLAILWALGAVAVVASAVVLGVAWRMFWLIALGGGQ